jgi:hypothetical protein
MAGGKIWIKEKDKAIAWVQKSVLWAFITLFIAVPLGYPAQQFAEQGFNRSMVNWAVHDYFGNLLARDVDGSLFWMNTYMKWVSDYSRLNSFPPPGLYIPILMFLFVLFVGIGANPYPFNPMHKGGARKAADTRLA